MNDGGGGESSKETEPCLKKRRKNDEFAQAIATIAVAQICESVGFHGFQQSVLDTFADVACKYIREIGKTSNFYANLAGRTECNVFDIVQGLEDLSLTRGFVGASDRDHSLSGSGIIKEISQYVDFSEEIGFAYALPSFPVIKEQRSTPSFLQAGEMPPSEDIPIWLPKFPDPKTHISMTSDRAKEIQTRSDRTEEELKVLETSDRAKEIQTRYNRSEEELKVLESSDIGKEIQTTPDRTEEEHKVLERPSPKSELRLPRNVYEFPGFVEPVDNAGREQTKNPFLVVPLQPGEKEVSLVSLPAKLQEEDVMKNHSLWVNHISTLDTFALEDPAVKTGDCSTKEGSRNDLSNNRPSVRMKFRMDKKTLDTTTNRYNDKGKLEVASWFVNDDSREEKEKRTEKLPKEPMVIEEHTGNDSVVN